MDEIPEVLMDLLQNAHRYENYIHSICPFHDDTRASFFVYADKYRCAACGRWGETKDLVEKLDKTHFYPKQQEQLYSRNPFSKWLKGHILPEILMAANSNLPIHYLKDRRIDADVQSNLHLGLLDGWITFPIVNPLGKIIGAVARAGEGNLSKSKYVLPFQQDPNLLYVPSWKRCNMKDTIYLTFGILDAVTLYAAGYASMSTTTGKRISPSVFDYIRKRIIIVPDSNEEFEAHRLASKLGWRGKVLLLQYPDGCKDINDIPWKKHYTLEQLKELIG